MASKSQNVDSKPIGEDGYNKDQRYYYAHPEVKVKNRDRQRVRRAKEKEQKRAALSASTNEVASTSTGTSTCIISTPSMINTENLPPRPKKRQRASSITTINANTRPIDFLEQRATVPSVSWEATNSVICGGEDERQPETPRDHCELVSLELLERDILQWSSGWGGVTYWAYGLDASFQKAVDKRQVNQWRKQMADHAALGRSLLRRIHVDEGRLPDEDWKKREMFYKKLELAVMLVKGLTILELKTPLFPNSGTAVKYRYHRETEEEQSAVETDIATMEVEGNDGDESDISADTSDGEGWLGILQKDARGIMGQELADITLGGDQELEEDIDEEEADERQGFYTSDADDDA